jgi:hypothetical protein
MQGIANVSWALAKLDCSFPSILSIAVASIGQGTKAAFKPQEVLNILWACVKARYYPKVRSLESMDGVLAVEYMECAFTICHRIE